MFVWTGSAKFPDMKGFRGIVAMYGIIPDDWLWLSYLVPIIELVIAASLIPGIFCRFGASLSIFLVLIFIAFLMAGLFRGISLGNCGCFGSWTSVPLSWRGVWEDVGFLLVSVLILVGDNSFLTVDGWFKRKRDRQAGKS